METTIRGHPLIFKCLTGSRAYGTNLPDSDYDYNGVYIQSNYDILGGFKYHQQIEIGKDEVYWELERFVNLAMTANPTVLQLLFTDSSIEFEDPVWNILRQNRSLFLTRNCINSFGGYVTSQIIKATGLGKKVNWKKEDTVRKTPLDFCYFNNGDKPILLSEYLKKEGLLQKFCGLSKLPHFADTYCLYYDYSGHYGETLNNNKFEPIGFRGIVFEQSNDIRLSDIPKDQLLIGLINYNRNEYSKHCTEYKSYQDWLENCNESRYIKTSSGNTIDGKNMLHCMRLLAMCREIVEEGTINIYREKDKDYLLSIRRGEVDLEKLVVTAKQELIDLRSLYDKSNLPERVDSNILHDIIYEIRTEYAEERRQKS